MLLNVTVTRGARLRKGVDRHDDGIELRFG
jgi:hypothetical protein